MDYEAVKKAILSSQTIDELKRSGNIPPVPVCDEDQNYVFISYSHRDYRSVFCDLLEFHREGVRYWYDSGLPAGEEWDKVVESKIKGAGCAGVIFYLSENLFLSRSVNKEVEFTVEGGEDGAEGKKRFCINLEGISPKQILKKIIRNYDDDELEKFGVDDRMLDLLQNFSDKTTYITKASTEDSGHISETLQQIRNQFNVTSDGFPIENDEEVKNLRKELDLAKTFVIKDGVLKKYVGEDTRVFIPDSVTSIGESAFSVCSSLQSINIPDSVTSIGESAFCGCSSLQSINIPDSVTGIGAYAFGGCSSLQSINIPDSVTSIGANAFWGCKGLQTINIPDSVTSIGERAFCYCSSLQSINIPDSVTSIGEYAFSDCSSLQSINIPDSVTGIGADAFWGCEGLQSINIPDSVTFIGESAFSVCSSLQSMNIPDSVTYIGAAAFFRCLSLQSINIPDSVTSIGESAFYGCSSLQSIDIPDSVTGIGADAFGRCLSLQSIDIPDSVTSIGERAFWRCKGLQTINIPDSVTSIGESAFFNCRLSEIIYKGTMEEWNKIEMTEAFDNGKVIHCKDGDIAIS